MSSLLNEGGGGRRGEPAEEGREATLTAIRGQEERRGEGSVLTDPAAARAPARCTLRSRETRRNLRQDLTGGLLIRRETAPAALPPDLLLAFPFLRAQIKRQHHQFDSTGARFSTRTTKMASVRPSVRPSAYRLWCDASHREKQPCMNTYPLWLTMLRAQLQSLSENALSPGKTQLCSLGADN